MKKIYEISSYQFFLFTQSSIGYIIIAKKYVPRFDITLSNMANPPEEVLSQAIRENRGDIEQIIL
ncbi:MAG: hypothetical protein WCP15_01780 [bacterium]